jgi:hypothetical protein
MKYWVSSLALAGLLACGGESDCEQICIAQNQVFDACRLGVQVRGRVPTIEEACQSECSGNGIEVLNIEQCATQIRALQCSELEMDAADFGSALIVDRILVEPFDTLPGCGVQTAQ